MHFGTNTIMPGCTCNGWATATNHGKQCVYYTAPVRKSEPSPHPPVQVSETPQTKEYDMFHPELKVFAGELQAAGFTVFASKRTERPETFFYFEKDGFYGTVERGINVFGDIEFSMPIRPSREFGSSMFVPQTDSKLTVANARLVCQPTNRNHIIGTHDNYKPSSIGLWYFPVEERVTADTAELVFSC